MELLQKLSPAVSFKIWGGQKLKSIKNLAGSQAEVSQAIGETWEISSHPSAPSRLALNKTCLNELASLSYLVKYIDTADNLSIQVHPDDEYAGEHENERGKTECWLALECEKGAGVYLGFKNGVTKKEFRTALEAGLKVDQFLNFYPARPGDFFVVPAGAVHALGAGVTLVEVQQSSGVTYRVWDWNRKGDDGRPRELHIEKAMEVLRFEEGFNRQLEKMQKSGLLEETGTRSLYKHPDFKAELISLNPGDHKEVGISAKEGATLVAGKLEIDGTVYNKFDSAISINKGVVSVKALEKSSLLCVKDREN